MPQNNIMGFALDMIQHNLALQNNPNAREMIDVIKSGDANRGQQIARNLCNTYGVKPEDAIAQGCMHSISPVISAVPQVHRLIWQSQ